MSSSLAGPGCKGQGFWRGGAVSECSTRGTAPQRVHCASGGALGCWLPGQYGSKNSALSFMEVVIWGWVGGRARFSREQVVSWSWCQGWWVPSRSRYTRPIAWGWRLMTHDSRRPPWVNVSICCHVSQKVTAQPRRVVATSLLWMWTRINRALEGVGTCG